MTQVEAPTVSSTGFELFEKMVGEYRTSGKSRTLDAWLASLRPNLTAVKRQNPRLQKDLAAAEAAVNLAAELVVTLGKVK